MRRTASRRTPPGRPRSPASRPRPSRRWRAGCTAAARSSWCRTPCSAPSMASSPSGWAPCSPPRSGRSACPAAATAMRWARSPITGGGRTPCRWRPCRKAATVSRTSFLSRASPTCCWTRARPTATTARPGPIPTSASSTGPAATRSITTRISTGCGAPSRGSTPSSCTSSAGRRRRGTPISSCPAP